MLAHRWWPVLVWLGVIRLESTDFASANNTSTVLYTVIAAVAPQVQVVLCVSARRSPAQDGTFHRLRHPSGLVFLALKNTNYDRLRPLLQRPWGSYWRDFWRWEWVAAWDAGYHRDRCGRRNSPIDSSLRAPDDGRTLCSIPAARRCCQVIVYFLSRRAFKRRRERSPTWDYRPDGKILRACSCFLPRQQMSSRPSRRSRSPLSSGIRKQDSVIRTKYPTITIVDVDCVAISGYYTGPSHSKREPGLA